MSSLPPIPTNSESPFQRLNKFLDQHLLPYPVKFLTNRVIILATLALLVLLIFFTGDQSFVNASTTCRAAAMSSYIATMVWVIVDSLSTASDQKLEARMRYLRVMTTSLSGELCLMSGRCLNLA